MTRYRFLFPSGCARSTHSSAGAGRGPLSTALTPPAAPPPRTFPLAAPRSPSGLPGEHTAALGPGGPPCAEQAAPPALPLGPEQAPRPRELPRGPLSRARPGPARVTAAAPAAGARRDRTGQGRAAPGLNGPRRPPLPSLPLPFPAGAPRPQAPRPRGLTAAARPGMALGAGRRLTAPERGRCLPAGPGAGRRRGAAAPGGSRPLPVTPRGCEGSPGGWEAALRRARSAGKEQLPTRKGEPAGLPAARPRLAGGQQTSVTSGGRRRGQLTSA